MNNHIPDAGKMVCPKCGAGVMLHGSGTTFTCGTWVFTDGTVDQSRECTYSQRDQLRAQVEQLEAARTKAAANSLANMLAHEEVLRRINELHSECDAYMSAATAWKMYAGRLEADGDDIDSLLEAPDSNCSCHISPPCSDCVDYGDIREMKANWTATKQTKPKPEGLR